MYHLHSNLLIQRSRKICFEYRLFQIYVLETLIKDGNYFQVHSFKFPVISKSVLGIERHKRFMCSFDHCSFTFPNPNSGVVLLLVWCFWSIRVTYLTLVPFFCWMHIAIFAFCLSFIMISETLPVCPLSVGVNIHLDYAVLNCFFDLLLR